MADPLALTFAGLFAFLAAASLAGWSLVRRHGDRFGDGFRFRLGRRFDHRFGGDGFGGDLGGGLATVAVATPATAATGALGLFLGFRQFDPDVLVAVGGAGGWGRRRGRRCLGPRGRPGVGGGRGDRLQVFRRVIPDERIVAVRHPRADPREAVLRTQVVAHPATATAATAAAAA